MRATRFGLGRKLGAIYLGLGVVIVGAVLVATVGTSGIGTDARRLIEENREARITARLVAALERLSPASVERGRQIGTLEPALAEASAALRDMIEGADETDPSEARHQSKETDLVDRIESDLTALDAWSRSEQQTLDAGLAGRLLEGRRLAQALRRETDDEAREASDHLLREIERLQSVFAAGAAVSLAVLVLGFVLVDRNLVRPVRSLREGTRRFGAGDLDRRVPVETGDEIGELAREFNAMADRLSQSHRDLEHRVEERTRQLHHAARLAGLGTLAAGIAHEVNTPLATIASCAEGLERRARNGTLDRETQLSYLETIVREAFRAREITGDVLAFARKDPGEIALQDLEPGLRDAARMLERMCAERRVSIDVSIDPRLPQVGINRSEMRQAVVNLLKNAVEVTPAGDAVRLSAYRHDGGVAIEVRDRGPGIPPQFRDEIFDPFFTTKAAGSGTGLGLSLVYGIVERHGGTVALDERVTDGALFRIVLPCPGAEASA